MGLSMQCCKRSIAFLVLVLFSASAAVAMGEHVKTLAPAPMPATTSAPVATAAAAATVSDASPALEPIHIETRYDGSFAGLTLGRLRTTMDMDAQHYSIKLDTKLRGLARVFGDMRSFAEAQGVCKAIDSCLPKSYSSTEEKDDKKKSLDQHIIYDAKGAIAERERDPLDDPNWRAVVPLALASTGVDPVSAYVMLRPKLQEALAKNAQETYVRTYDGARLAVMHFHIHGRKHIEIMDKKVSAVDTTITRSLMQGYTEKEKKKFAEGDPEIHIYFSDDARLLPLLVTIDLPAGEFRIYLAELRQL